MRLREYREIVPSFFDITKSNATFWVVFKQCVHNLYGLTILWHNWSRLGQAIWFSWQSWRNAHSLKWFQNYLESQLRLSQSWKWLTKIAKEKECEGWPRKYCWTFCCCWFFLQRSKNWQKRQTRGDSVQRKQICKNPGK